MDSVWTILHSELQKDPVTNADFTRFVLQIYYVSKNWVYSKDGEPLHELKDLQNRIDMSRSLVLICVVGEIIILVMWILFLLFYAYLRLVKGSSIRFHWLNINAVTVIVVLVISRACYHIEERNYLKRAYGYYISHVNQLKLEQKENSSRMNVYLHPEE
jgi:NADH:ubiquinone oxidoreductase subunit K